MHVKVKANLVAELSYFSVGARIDQHLARVNLFTTNTCALVSVGIAYFQVIISSNGIMGYKSHCVCTYVMLCYI